MPSSTIYDSLVQLQNKNITFAKTSYSNLINGVSVPVYNIYNEYMDLLLANSVYVNLTEREYSKYKYNSKLLAYDLYGDTELFFIIFLLNDIITDHDFDQRKIKVLSPDKLGLLNDIYNIESKSIMKSTDKIFKEEEKRYDVDDIDGTTNFGSFETRQISDTNSELSSIKLELQRIKRIIVDEVHKLFKDSSSAAVEALVKEKLLEIEKQIQKITESSIEQILQDKKLYEKVEKNIKDIKDIKTLMDNLSTTNLESRIARVETKLEELKDSIAKTIDDNVKKKIDTLTKDFDDFKSKMEKLVGDNNKEIIKKLREDLDALMKKLSSKEFVFTRDIVFTLDTPIVEGIHEETEFFVPYTGTIESVAMSVRPDTKLESNLIMYLQKFDRLVDNWVNIQQLEVHASDKWRIQDINKIPISKEFIRLVLEEGDYKGIRAITVITQILPSTKDEEENTQTP